MAEHIRITYDGKLALTAMQAATRYGLKPDAMRQVLLRLKRDGRITELPDALDGGTKLYPATTLDRAMKARPGKGRITRAVRRTVKTAPATRPPADYVPFGDRKPYTVAALLSDLRGPISGTVSLPIHLDWSGSPQRNLDNPHDLRRMYEIVLTEAQSNNDLTTWLDGETLVRVWPDITLPRRVQQLWEDRFPDLHHEEGGWSWTNSTGA